MPRVEDFAQPFVCLLLFDSRKFCGVAQMTSEMDWHNTDPHWLEDVWEG